MRLARVSILLALALAAAGALQAETQASSKQATSWVIGFARFSSAEASGPESILLDTLPRLIVSDLRSLPARRVPETELAELAELKALRARFAAGAELAAKLDSRASGFFSYTDNVSAWRSSLDSSDKDIEAARKKLDTLLADQAQGEDKGKALPPQDLTVKLWPDHANGKLIDAPTGSLAQAAKAASVDLIVTGSLSFNSGYVIVKLLGFDSGLGREVFSWKAFGSADDPQPLAVELAEKIEAWVAGRPMARVEIKVEPASAEISVNGKLLQGTNRVVYAYEDAPLVVDADASGFSPATATIDLHMGERRLLPLKLDPIDAGLATITTDPPDAHLSQDSVPLDDQVRAIKLDGARSFVEASAPGRESATVVLPSSGEPDIAIKLRLADELGQKGRIEAAKDRFYTAFGFFASSIPLTALSLGVYNGYYEAWDRASSSYKDELAIASNLPYYALGGCITLSCVTAAFSIFRLVQYLGATN